METARRSNRADGDTYAKDFGAGAGAGAGRTGTFRTDSSRVPLATVAAAGRHRGRPPHPAAAGTGRMVLPGYRRAAHELTRQLVACRDRMRRPAVARGPVVSQIRPLITALPRYLRPPRHGSRQGLAADVAKAR